MRRRMYVCTSQPRQLKPNRRVWHANPSRHLQCRSACLVQGSDLLNLLASEGTAARCQTFFCKEHAQRIVTNAVSTTELRHRGTIPSLLNDPGPSGR